MTTTYPSELPPSLDLSEFESSQPFATAFFNRALQHQHLVSTYALIGEPTDLMGRFVLRLAQIVNCSDPPQPSTACGRCRNCLWVGANQHPDILTLTNQSFLYEWDHGGHQLKPKTSKANQTISVGQLEALQVTLNRATADFTRVVIIAQGERPSVAQETEKASFPAPPDVAEEEDLFQLKPLDRRCFPEQVANKFLKTLEEPPKNVMFFLLTDDESKLMDTIVSRCQRIPFQSDLSHHHPQTPDEAGRLFEMLLWPPPQSLWLDRAQILQDELKELGLSTAQGYEWAQQQAWHQLRQQCNDPISAQQVIHKIRALEKARQMTLNKTREDAVLDQVLLQIH